LVYSQSTTVLSQCIDTLAGPLCLDLSSEECFELTGTISLGGSSIFGPRTIPIADLLTQIQNQKDDPTAGNLMCFQLTQASAYGTCSLCATIDELEIIGNSIHYCGTGQFNCSSLIAPLFQPFTIPCFDLTNCGLFNCRNDCNQRGRCTSFGMCECDSGYYGYDCSIQLTKNCVSGPLFNTTCWEITEECDLYDVELSSGSSRYVMQYKAEEFTEFPIVPCKPVINEENLVCDLCLNMENIQQDTQLGCPTIEMTCNSISARSDRIDCVPLSIMQLLTSCDASPSPSTSFSFSNQIMFGLALIVVVLVVLTIGFFIAKKFGVLSPRSTPDLYIEEDEEPLNSDY